MRILGIDISKTVGSVGLIQDRRILGEHKFEAIANHKASLLCHIDRLLGEVAVEVQEVDGVSVAIGPGSFTGLRVGLATAKGLCLPRNLPLAGVSTLEALASLLPYCRLPVLATIDARRGEIYAALYHTENGMPVRIGAEVSLPPEKLYERFNTELVILGEGLDTYGERLAGLYGGKAHLVRTHGSLAGGGLVALLGIEKILKGQLLPLEDAVPVYIRPVEKIFGNRS